MKRILILSFIPIISIATHISDFQGKYTLIEAKGDDFYIIPRNDVIEPTYRCPSTFIVKYYPNSRKLTTNYESNDGRNTFENINAGKYSIPGLGRGFKTYMEGDAIINVKDYRSFLGGAIFTRSMRLDDKQLIYSEHDDRKDIDLECVYERSNI